ECSRSEHAPARDPGPHDPPRRAPPAAPRTVARRLLQRGPAAHPTPSTSECGDLVRDHGGAERIRGTTKKVDKNSDLRTTGECPRTHEGPQNAAATEVEP